MIKAPNTEQALRLWKAWSRWARYRSTKFYDYGSPRLGRNCAVSSLDIPYHDGGYPRDRYPGTGYLLEEVRRGIQKDLEA